VLDREGTRGSPASPLPHRRACTTESRLSPGKGRLRRRSECAREKP
jgi:hypothetical protein